MRIRWLPIALVVSLLANLALACGWGLQVLSEAVLEADTGSTFDLMAAERAELRAMRAHFCPHTPEPDRAALLAWEAATRPTSQLSDPFEKDGLLWLRHTGVRLDQDGRADGVCLSHAWGVLDEPTSRQQDAAGEFCPIEPLC